MPDVFLLDGSSAISAGGGLRIPAAAGWSIYPTTWENHAFTDRDKQRYSYWPAYRFTNDRLSWSLRDSAVWITSPKRSDLRCTGT